MSNSYSYDDWLEGKRFSEWGLMPDGFLEASGLSEQDAIDVYHNDPGILHHRGYLSDVEYRRILNAYREVSKAAIEYFKARIPDFIEEFIKNEYEKEFVLKQRLRVVDNELSNNEAAREINDLISGKYPITAVTGPIYYEIVNEGNVEKYIERFYETITGPLLTTILPEINGKQPISFFKTAILYEERRLINIKLLKETISKQKILDTYIDIKKNTKEREAFDYVENWLINEVGYTEDEVKEKFDITLTADALKKRVNRLLKRKIK